MTEQRTGARKAEVVLFHHVQGSPMGCACSPRSCAPAAISSTRRTFRRRAASEHRGRRRAHPEHRGRGARGRADPAVADLPAGLVYAGFSFGAAVAQRLAQTRPGASGALLYESCIPITGEWAFGPWPDGVPVQIHGMDKDPFFALEGDIDAARELV